MSNMGWRYVSYRMTYELKRKSGLLKRRFPVSMTSVKYVSLAEWRESSQPFFFCSGGDLSFEKNPTELLKKRAENILSGNIPFFSHQYMNLGIDYDWLTNPGNGYKYDITKHWTEVNDYSRDNGDIKYVWEKSRFSYLYTIIRYDYHFDDDHSEFVFSEIENWMNANPVNQGPNYKCSQEISLRLLNWIFILYFYKHSPYLTETLFQRMVHSVYWQLHHVYKNINFSRIAVRNNHAITETLTLYIVSALFPWYPESAKWKREGRNWFEQEIAYQIYDDGSYLQFSMNYHRVVIQLLTWAIRIAELHQERFMSVVYEKAYKSVNFLYQCQEDSNGYLPNYGSNDGALFFKLSDNDYRDYRPQLNALHLLLTGQSLYQEKQEDIHWYGGYNTKGQYPPLKKERGILSFSIGGYYFIREEDTLTFIRCGNHKDRPAHADNLHIDVWYQGQNLLPDGGTYKYNTDTETLKYFMGTESHNTVMLGKYDQMLKGARFVWYNWTQAQDVVIDESESTYFISGIIHCFTYLGKNITHTRKVTKQKGKPEWDVEDIITNKPDQLLMRQIWHILPDSSIRFESDTDRIEGTAYYSSYYGEKKEMSQTVFQTNRNTIHTHISITT
jgi:hypothetical protein